MTITESLGEKWGGGLSYERRHLRICICIYGLSSRAGTVLARIFEIQIATALKAYFNFPPLFGVPGRLGDCQIALHTARL